MPIPNRHKHIRLPGFNYASAGGYFVTICVAGRASRLGEIVNGAMKLSKIGEIVGVELLRSMVLRRELTLDYHVIMPNHLHAIVMIAEHDAPLAGSSQTPESHGRATLQRRPRSLSSFVAGFKAASTRAINLHLSAPGQPFWQKGFYERVIRNEDELRKMREYIVNNPLQWALDEENPINRS